VFNVLLQILDDGRVTDSQGRTVDFKNTVIIMTSNIGAPRPARGHHRRRRRSRSARDQVMAELRRHFRPEFLNRVDDTSARSWSCRWTTCGSASSAVTSSWI
jgi:ATP-dependent Clp protease ATP-binding subunit ClpB